MKTAADAASTLPKPTLAHGTTRAFRDAVGDWDDVFQRSDSRPEHASTALQYYMEYDGFSAGKVVDLSYVAYIDNKPAAIMPLFATRGDAGWRLSSCGSDVMRPAFAAILQEKTRKAIADSHLTYIDDVARRLEIAEWHNTDYCDAQGLSLWHRILVERGIGARFSHDLFLDLKLSDEDVKKNMRKSSRSFFNQVDKYWQVEVHQDPNPSVFREFHQLHVQVAGRETRSQGTWDLQEAAVAKRQAFWISMRSFEDKSLIGAAYFMLAPKTAYYGVGAYDRTKFSDAPIGHLAQFVALRTMRALGIEWYHLGERPYKATHPAVDDKNLSIAHFKEGMASHLFTRVRTSLNAKVAEAPQ